LFEFRNHRHIARFSVLGGGFWVSSHVQLVAREVHISPRNMLGLANSQPAVSEEAYKICAILRLPRACAADYLDKLQEFFAGRKLQSLLPDLIRERPAAGLLKRAPVRIASSKIARNVPMLLLTTLAEYRC